MSATIPRRTAMSVLAALPVVAIPASDRDLTQMAAEYLHLQALKEPVTKRFFELPENDPELEIVSRHEIALSEQQDAISDKMMGIKATSLEGLRAKALVGRQIFLRHGWGENHDEFPEEDTSFAWALINDLLNRRIVA